MDLSSFGGGGLRGVESLTTEPWADVDARILACDNLGSIQSIRAGVHG